MYFQELFHFQPARFRAVPEGQSAWRAIRPNSSGRKEARLILASIFSNVFPREEVLCSEKGIIFLTINVPIVLMLRDIIISRRGNP
jgi:hypothetical protein